jgi:hypothetical protein
MMQAMTWNSSAVMRMTRSRSVLDRGDDQQRDHFTVGAHVLADAELRQLEHLLVAGAGVAQDFDGGPLPEGGVFGEADVDGMAAVFVVDADVVLAVDPLMPRIAG